MPVCPGTQDDSQITLLFLLCSNLVHGSTYEDDISLDAAPRTLRWDQN